MNKLLYGKLAGTNIRKNMQVYLPYILTSVGMILVFYILRSMAFNDNIYNYDTEQEAFKGAIYVAAFLEIASNVAAIFAFIFLLFANSFVMKRRKKQLGLYSIMGMERKHIAAVLLIETLITTTISLVVGLCSGMLLDKLMLMLLLKILKKEIPDGFYINGESIGKTLVLFAAVFLFTMGMNWLQIARANTIELLKGNNVGEKEPKTKLLMTIIGGIALITGYTIAVRVNTTFEAVNNFFMAVIFVMVGTYFLFIAGSITVLKGLRKNKRFYYKTQNFISISGMIYRMKQNAAGLASICLLSTSAILVLSAGAALYIGGENSIAKEFPREVRISVEDTTEQTLSTIETCVQEASMETGLIAENIVWHEYSETLMMLEQDTLSYCNRIMTEGVYDVYFLTQEEYNRFSGTKMELLENEILLYDIDGIYGKDTITIGKAEYKIKERFENDCINYIKRFSMTLLSDMVIVVKDKALLQQMYGEGAEEAGRSCYYGFDVEGDADTLHRLGQVLEVKLSAKGLPKAVSLKQDSEADFLAMYGGIFFVGLFMGVLFLIATVMIIYYKQISEGFDDRERFIIMQKVGMTKSEIKKTIHSQVVMVFFLPLIIAVIHMTFAFHIVTLFIRSVVFIDTPLMIISVAVTSLIFSLVYCIVYHVTSGEYYRIVNE